MTGSVSDRYGRRLDKAQEALRDHAIDALLIGPSADLRYLTGIHAHSSERMNLLVLPASGDPTMIVPGLEAPLIDDASGRVTLRTWGDGDEPAGLVAETLTEVASAAVGNRLWSAFLLRLQKVAPSVKWSEANDVIRTLRMIKDEDEIANLEKAAHLTDVAWETFTRSGSISGLTERQALARLMEISGDQGLSAPYGIIGSGPNSASPHHSGDDRVIQDGDALVFDWGGKINDYLSDVTRSAHVGEPGEEYRTVYDTVNRANQAAFEAMKPGVPLQEIDRAARGVITEAGYGEYFTHRLGHGLGLEIHEEPYLTEGNKLPLAPGMVVSDEPGIYLEGRFGVRIEDAVVGTEHGARRLNVSSHDLVIFE